MKLTAWRVALRIARRDALRAKGRSALVLAMIALPVLGVTGADVFYRSGQLTPSETAVRTLGGADALVSVLSPGIIATQAPNADEGRSGRSPVPGTVATPEQQKSLSTDATVLVKQLLPTGSVLIPVAVGNGGVTSTKDGQLRVSTAEADLTDPVWRGKLNLTGGRAPAAPQEIAATQHFLDEAGLKVGDTTTVRGLEGKPFTITAAVEYPGSLKNDALIGRPGSLLAPLADKRGDTGDRAVGKADDWLVKLPAGAVLDWPKVLELNKYGFTATSRTVLFDPPARSQVPYFVDQDRYQGENGMSNTVVVALGTVAGMALLEIVLLAGPAFAVGARRSRRQLGLLAAGGGDRSHVRAVVLGGGVVLGLAGAVTGVVLAIVSVAAVRPLAEMYSGSRFGHFGLEPLDLLGIAAIGLVTGLLAAIVPAVQASRQDVVEALTGRGSVKPASRKLALLGLLMVVGGAALALGGQAFGHRTTAVLGGSMIAELGMVACTPVLVGLFGRLGRWLPLSPRLALRDSVRHRGRTAPAVAAVMAAVAGTVAVGIYSASNDQQNREHYEARLPSGGVAISLGWSRDVDTRTLSQQADAVERSIPALGARGDIFQTHYKGDCRTSRECGSVDIVLPKERRCPANDPDVTQQLSPADFNRLSQDPRCRNQTYYSGGYGSVPSGDATVLRNLFGVKDPAAEQALAQGKAVVFDAKYLKDGKVTIGLQDPWKATATGASVGPGGVVAESSKPQTHLVTVDAVLTTAQVQAGAALITPETAQRLGMTTSPSGAVWLPTAAPSSSSEQKAIAAASKISSEGEVQVERGYRSQQTLTMIGLSGFAAVVALGAAGIATGLAAADSQRDLATLAAVGATGGIRRRLSGFQCGVIAAMGAVLGTISGVVPAVALRKVEALASGASGMQSDLHSRVVIAIPWQTLGLTLIGLPTVAVLLAMLFTRSRLTLGRRSE
ncbi:FtsX-like permease family protein [Kitasatospora sp. McL0602]|uniref:FtsX-like permease family protein n=1 Tax=Kitasatospora sp. McL0602 TaxID=3439530 RepID=UPI003F8A87BF